MMTDPNNYKPLFPGSFKELPAASTEAVWTPVIVLRDMERRLQFKDYQGKERRQKMVLSTWLGPSAGFLNAEPHWIKYAPFPELSDARWKPTLLRPPSGMLLIHLPSNCPAMSYTAEKSYQFNIPGGFYFGVYSDKDRKWKAYYRVPGIQFRKKQTWPNLPADAIKKWLLVESKGQ